MNLCDSFARLCGLEWPARTLAAESQRTVAILLPQRVLRVAGIRGIKPLQEKGEHALWHVQSLLVAGKQELLLEKEGA